MPVYNVVLLFFVVLCAAADVALGMVVLQRNSRSLTNRCFAAAAALLGLWVVANFLSDQVPADHAKLLFLNRLTVSSGVAAGVMLFAFVLAFPHLRARIPILWELMLAVGVAFAALALFTPLLVADVTVESWGTNVVLGPLYVAFVAWELVGFVALSVNVFRRYRLATPREQLQFRYLYSGLAGFFVLELLFTGILPFVLGNNHLAQLVPFATLVFLMPTAYAMLRHRLLDVGSAAVRGAAYTLVLAGVAALMVVLAERWTEEIFSPLGLDARFGLFVVGLVAILGFQPLREEIDRASDRVLRQQTYDPDLLLRQLGDVIATTLDPEGVASTVAERLSREMKLAYVSMAFFRGGRPVTVSAGPHRRDAEMADLLEVSAKGRPVVADELESDDPAGPTLAAYEARVLLPLSHDGRRLGAIVLGPKLSGRVFSATDMRFLEILSTEVSVALQNATLFDERAQRVRELSALNELAAAIGTDIELEAVLRNALAQAVAVTRADAGSIMLADKSGAMLEIAAAIGLPEDVVASARERVGEGISGWVVANRQPIILLSEDDERLRNATVRDDISAAIAVPVIFKDEVIGVINLNRKGSPDPFTTENLNVVTSFAGQLAVAIKNARLYSDLEDTFLGTISSLAAAVDAKDPYTYGHSTEVTEYADAIGVAMELSESELHTLHIAATLHDIGKIGIDSSVLRKPSALDDDERAAMERHPSIAADILAPLDFLKDAVPPILFHHERYGGGGYPSGISGQTIPLPARIISVADSFNAMVSDRPYRAGLPWEAAVQELRDNAGTQFDPDVVQAFLGVLSERQTQVRPDLRVVGPATADHRAGGDATSHGG
jgi:HD-GYP domain-containing protein (c-di-GMP phosphodiesterase class II)